ncbi:hypothetical protein Droror1_Dr00007459 [Drosera rotundifolia]
MLSPSHSKTTPNPTLHHALLMNPSSQIQSPKPFVHCVAGRSHISTNAAVEKGMKFRAESAALGSLVVISFYKFADLGDYAEIRVPLKELCERLPFSRINNSTRVPQGRCTVAAPLSKNGRMPHEAAGTRYSLVKGERIVRFVLTARLRE